MNLDHIDNKFASINRMETVTDIHTSPEEPQQPEQRSHLHAIPEKEAGKKKADEILELESKLMS